MRKQRPLIFVLILIVISAPVLASDCGNGLPCGPVGWSLPPLPVLPSPTAIPTISINLTAVIYTPTPMPTAVAFPTNAALVTVDTVQIADSMATLNAAVDSTPEVVYDINGTPVDTDATFNELAGNAGTFFSYAKGVSNADLGAVSPLVGFLLLGFVTVVAIKAITYLLPVITAVFGIVRKIVEVVLEFIPL